MNCDQPAYMIQTWGCQMNEDDSLQMANLLEQMGYRQTLEESEADIILLNTCSVRAKPEQKVKSKLGELRLLKQEKRDLIIGVCGCMAQREGEELLKRASYVDLVLGTASIPELPLLIDRIRRGERRLLAIDMPERNGSVVAAHAFRMAGRVGLKMFIPVMYGCNNFCAYCVVPYARGPERSRPPEEIIAEITHLAAKKCKEVTLVGQNVNSYGQTLGSSRHPVDFAALLEMLNEVPGLERIRFMTSHPKDLSDRLIGAIADLPKVCEHLHLPIQAGDDTILRRMGRGYTVEHYVDLVEKLRRRVPGIALTTDVMVGFPGETEEQFRNTLATVEAIGYDAAFTFAFNARPGTAAARMDDQIDRATKMRRLNELISLQSEIVLRKSRSQVGSVVEVLVEGPSEKDPSRMTGYSRANRTVNFSVGGYSGQLEGSLVQVQVEKAHPWGFSGKLRNSR
jgi:tRNA-2-methylthio-N6-dimethylallyladenosine synthase